MKRETLRFNRNEKERERVSNFFWECRIKRMSYHRVSWIIREVGKEVHKANGIEGELQSARPNAYEGVSAA